VTHEGRHVTHEAPTGPGANARNVGLVARREYAERVKSRAFLFSTLLMMGLAVAMALIPLAFRMLERSTTTRIAVSAPEAALADRTVSILDAFLNVGADGGAGGHKTFVFEPFQEPAAAVQAVSEARVAGAVIVGGLAQDKVQFLQLGAFTVGVLDWTAANPNTTNPFVQPTFAVVDAGAVSAGGGGQATIDTSEYASRRIVGIVFVVLSFLTLVFYGLWVASGVVAEKANRVMELLISAATAPQLVIGKITGIGLAGLTQVSLVLVPAVATILLSGQLGNAILGEAPSASPLAGLSPGLLVAFLVYFVLGFALYAALYAGAGSLLSRAEDLQIVALPLSIPAIMGYLPAVLALSGSSAGFIRFASYVPLWSPFVMMARLAVGRVEPWELVLSLGLLIATVPLVTLLAIRVYRAGVLLYGQPPTVRTFLRAVRGG
jgi:ABC-2 type transport system permease protein